MKKMQKLIVVLIAISLTACNSSTHKTAELSKSEKTKYENIFNDLKEYLSKDNGKLWDHQLYGPVLFANRDNRMVIANEKDDKGLLSKDGNLFSGYLPNEFNIANTTINWNGKHWTMVALPLPEDYADRMNLIIHECFHRIQPKIGFDDIPLKSNNHLDEMNGRIYLKMELEALIKALSTDDENMQQEHIKNALLFRLYRYQLFPGAKETENLTELKEGLAEYTGSILSGRNDEDLRNHYISNIESLYKNPTFVSSFAYRTIPIYGYFMNQKDENWNKKINKTSNLTDYITQFYHVSIPTNLKDSISKIQDQYNYDSIYLIEVERDQMKKTLLAKLDTMFLINPTLTIPLQNMNIGYSPANLIPFKDLGTVYPNCRITDNWGILTVEKDALIDQNWSKITVSEPIEIGDKVIEGDGWKLELNEGWKIENSEGNYKLKEK